MTLLLGGCRRPIAEPEKIDPIYYDLVGEQTAHEKALVELQKEIEGLEKDLEKTPARDPNRKLQIRQIDGKRKNLVRLTQMAEFYRLRAESRKKFDREDYLRAFNAEKPWPDRSERLRYEAHKRLVNAPRNWDARVPKMVPPGAAHAKAAEKKSSGAQGEAAAAEGGAAKGGH